MCSTVVSLVHPSHISHNQCGLQLLAFELDLDVVVTEDNLKNSKATEELVVGTVEVVGLNIATGYIEQLRIVEEVVEIDIEPIGISLVQVTLGVTANNFVRVALDMHL
jgi:hypothetical protein